MKDELKISKELKYGLRSSLQKEAPSSILQNVLSRVKAKQTAGYVPDIQMPFVLTLLLIAAAGYYFYTNGLTSTLGSTDMSFEFGGLLTSNVFWFSLMAVSSVVFLDLVSQQRKVKKNNV
jgi:hypothetical protein